MIQTFKDIVSNQEIDITNLGTGIYLVKITNAFGLSQTKKLIKD